MKFATGPIATMILGTVLGPLAVYGDTLPPGGRLILTSEKPEGFMTGGAGVFRPADSSGFEKTKDYERCVVSVENMPFKKAFRVRTQDYRGEEYGVELVSILPQPVKQGDVLLVTFYLRGLETKHESGEVITTLRFQRHGPPWTGYLQIKCSLAAKQGWKKFQYPIVCGTDLPAGKSMITFHLGYANQTVEIGGVEVINYGKKVKVEDLPITRATYPGREPNAPWRKAAEERIEKLRKGDLTVIVKDTNGRPVENAAVKVDMQRHAFPFGSVVNPFTLFEMTAEGRTWTPREAARYKAMIKKLFSAVIVAGEIMWRQWERPSVRHEREAGIKAIDWANANGLKVVGQALMYPKIYHMPDNIKRLEVSRDVLDTRIKDHIEDEATALRGKIYAWQVINEPHCTYAYLLFDKLGGKTIPPVDASDTDWHDDWPDTVSRECLVEWYKLARACDPKAKLILNTSGILTYRGTNTECWRYNEKLYDYLITHQSPLDVITEEAHFVQDLTDPARVIEILDRFAKYKKEFWITEFDVITPDDQLQADYTRDFLTATFSHPSVGAFLLWGFWEANHWQPSAAMYRTDWTPKASGKVWEDLVLNKWWTREKGRTNNAGKYKVRGFQGEYVIEVTRGEFTERREITLPKEGTVLKVVIN